MHFLLSIPDFSLPLFLFFPLPLIILSFFLPSFSLFPFLIILLFPLSRKRHIYLCLFVSQLVN